MTKRNTNAPQGHHGTDIIKDRGAKFYTPLQEVPMADGRTPRGRFGYGKGRIEDAVVHQPDEYAPEVGKRRMSY